ncbi:MAG: peptide-methionine (S)-S-oxide reductase MsrA [Candidatus Saccharimonadales bacterium]
METATFGGGCYWCTEAFFQRVSGVEKVESGYSGGTVPNPTIDQVYAGQTGHAEVTQIIFNPKQISYKELLEIFFTMHDPTTPNRQGNDVGDEYRSIIFYNSPAQQKTAQEMIDGFAAGLWGAPIVTELVPLEVFYSAGAGAQDFYNRNPEASYCQLVINPKIQKLRHKFANKLKPANY